MFRSTTRLVPLALALALLACRDAVDIAGPDEPGRIGTGKGLTVLLTDAPGDFSSAVVTITRITLTGAGQPIDLLDEPYTGDLIDLQNAVATLVGGRELPAGSYAQLRLVLGGAYLEVETADGSRIYASSPDYEGLPAGAQVYGTLQMPSLGQSGLKIDLPGGRLDIGEGETIVMLDFDVTESFGHQAGNSGKWVMHPVVKAANVTFGGNALVQLRLAEGVTLPAGFALGGFRAVLAPAGGGSADTLAFTDANGDGTFEALYRGLMPGQYTLALIGPAGLFVSFGSTTFPLAVTVGAKATATQVITISATALPGSIVATLAKDPALTLPAGVSLDQWRARLRLNGAADSTDVAFTDANADGTYEARFASLVPGAYALKPVAPASVTATYDVATLPVSITLGSGATYNQAFILKTAVKP